MLHDAAGSRVGDPEKIQQALFIIEGSLEFEMNQGSRDEVAHTNNLAIQLNILLFQGKLKPNTFVQHLQEVEGSQEIPGNDQPVTMGAEWMSVTIQN